MSGGQNQRVLHLEVQRLNLLAEALSGGWSVLLLGGKTPKGCSLGECYGVTDCPITSVERP